MQHLDDATRTQLEAAAFRRLLRHLDANKDVQNIDLMTGKPGACWCEARRPFCGTL